MLPKHILKAALLNRVTTGLVIGVVLVILLGAGFARAATTSFQPITACPASPRLQIESNGSSLSSDIQICPSMLPGGTILRRGGL
jgi:hypothetical protein